MYCRFCRKEIPNNSIFCPNCGKKQEGESSKIDFQFFQGLGKYKKWGFIYIIWCLIHIGLLVFNSSEDVFYRHPYGWSKEINKIDAFYPFDNSLSNVLQWKPFWCDPFKNMDVYDLSELFFYTILFPLLICGIVLLCRKYDLSITRLKTRVKKIAKNSNFGFIILAVGFLVVLILGVIALGKSTKPIDPIVPIDPDSIECADTDEDDYSSNVFSTGDTPYFKYYGSNMECKQAECTGIKITAPELSDVVVIIKKNNKNGKVAGHAYIRAGDTYKINLPNGTYQTFFYYGEGWSPYKDMGNGVKGGFINDEAFSKDDPQEIYNAVLTYVLQLRRDGNFHAESSNRSELF